MQIPMGFGGPFQQVNPDPPLLLTRPAQAAMDPIDGTLAAYSRGTLVTLARDEEGRFERSAESQLDGEEREPAVLGVAGGTLLVGREDGRLQVYDAPTLHLDAELQPEGRNQPRFIAAAPDGQQFAIVFHNGNLWRYDVASHSLDRPHVDGQGDISAAAFTPSGDLLVADRTVRVTRYSFPDAKVAERYAPKLGLMGIAYRYGLIPLYTIFPKPGELDKTVQYLLSGRDTKRFDRDDLAAAQSEIDPWTPVWSSGIFTIAVLLFACLYIEWQDF